MLYCLGWKGSGASQSSLGLTPINLWKTLRWGDPIKSQKSAKMGLPHEVPYTVHCLLHKRGLVRRDRYWKSYTILLKKKLGFHKDNFG